MLMIVSSGSLSVAALCPAQTSAFKLTAFNVAPPDALEMTLDDRRHIILLMLTKTARSVTHGIKRARTIIASS